MVDFSKRVVVPEQVLARQLDDEMVILDLKSEHYFGLDDVGTAMWNEVTQAESIERAYQQLLEQFDVEPETLRTDLNDLVQKLVDSQLLEFSIE